MSVLQKILGRQNKAPIPVPTPEWPELDGQILIRKLTPQQRAEFYSVANKQEATGGAAFVVFVATWCAVTADGQPAFDETDWKELLSDPGSGSALERLSDQADEINLLSMSAREALKKKYETTPPSASTSDSAAKTESA
jgi:hypothetical protein